MSAFTHFPFYTAPSNDCGNFSSLFRLIDDYDKQYSRSTGRDSQARPTRRFISTFTPRFDVRETENNYELHGELPGVDRKDIDIDFSDIQTIVVRGTVERNYKVVEKKNVPVPAAADDQTSMSGAIAADKPDTEDSETRSNKSYQATVEDDYEEIEANPASSTTVDNSSTEKSSSSSPAEKPAVEKSAAQDTPKPEAASGGERSARYWVAERSVGSFSRSFVFSNRIDHDNVSASLENGILTVIVPKAKKPAARHVVIY